MICTSWCALELGKGRVSQIQRDTHFLTVHTLPVSSNPPSLNLSAGPMSSCESPDYNKLVEAQTLTRKMDLLTTCG
jgi:hypothetical protein